MRGFTLIELLIVIAIIAILALIAIPNFIEAQTRAKVSRAHADMRTVATALEAYFVDSNDYPRALASPSFDDDYWGYSNYLWYEGDQSLAHVRGRLAALPRGLTTPIAYLSSRPPVDPFQSNETSTLWNYSYHYYNFHTAANWNRVFGPAPANQITSLLESPAPMRFNGRGGRAYSARWTLMSPGPSLQSEYPVDGYSRPTVKTRYFMSNNDWWTLMTEGAPVSYDPTNGTVSLGNIWRLSDGGDAR